MSIIKQGLAFLTGADEIGYFGKRIKRETSARKGRIVTAWRKAFPRIVSTPSPDPYAAFREIATRNGLDRNEIRRRENRHWWLFAGWFVACAVVLACCIGTVRPALHSPLGLGGAIAPFFLILPLSALAVRHAFWHWQLRTRKLGSFREWADRPREWLPALLLIAGASAAFAFPEAAQAATSIPATISSMANAPTGEAGTMIGTLMPGMFATATPFTLAIGAFSALLTAYATAILAYGVLHSLVASAHEGIPFGKDTHPIWGPIKAAVGMGMLVPAFPSGLSAVHGIVLLFAIMGSNLADGIWTTYVNQVITQAQPASPSAASLGVGVPESGLTVAKNILKMESCRAVFVSTQATSQARGLPFYGVIPPAPPAGGTTANGQTAWSYGACGSVYLPAASGLTANELTYQTARVAALSALVTAVQGTGLAATMGKAPMPVSTEEAYRNQPQFGDATETATWPAAIVAPLTAAAQQYETSLSTAASAYIAAKESDARGKLAADAKTYGWMGAGLFYRDLGAINSGVATLANTPPAYTIPRLASYGRDGTDRHAEAVLHQVELDWTQQSAVNVVSATDFTGPLDQDSDLLTRLLAPVSHKVAQAVTGLSAAVSGGADPMTTQINFGHAVLDAGWAGVAGGTVVAAGAGNWITSAVGAAAAWEWASKWGFMLLAGLFVVGSIHAYILPMMPFVFLLYASVSWITAIAEAMICAPIWAAMFMKWQGDGLIDGPQRAGAHNMIGILFRPAVTILAFIATLQVFPLAVNWFNSTWATAFVGQQGGHITGLTGWIVGLGWGGIISYHLGLRVLGFTARAFDSMAGVWGGQAEGGGEHEQSHNVLGVINQQRGGVKEAIAPPRGGPGKPNAPKPEKGAEAEAPAS